MIVSGKLKEGMHGLYISANDGKCYFVHETNQRTNIQGDWELSERKDIIENDHHYFLSYSYKATYLNKTDDTIVSGIFHETTRYTTGGVGYIEDKDGNKHWVAKVEESDCTVGTWAITVHSWWNDSTNRREFRIPILLEVLQ